MVNILLKELYKITIDSVKDSRESTKFIFEKSDQIIIWIIGFFVAVITYILSKIGVENVGKLTKDNIQYIILLNSFYILIFGLLFRLFSFLTQIILNNITESFLGFSRGFIIDIDKIPQPREITEQEKVEDLIFYLENDFGYNAKLVSGNYSEDYRILLTNFYKELSKSNNVEIQLKTFYKSLSKYYGTTIDLTKKTNQDNYIIKRALFYNIFMNLSITSFVLTFVFIIFLSYKILDKIFLIF